jgi:hypothetical protein
MAATSGLSKSKRRLFRRGQTGQSLIILAIGFVALLGFVGIVTDVSLLFVRYSTLRRAVDAAAVAAAGQMRRAPMSVSDVDPAEFAALGIDPNNPADANKVERFLQGREQATSVANLNLAARQFIEVYGLEPSQVLVETCYTQNLPMVQVGSSGVYRPADRDGVLLYNYQNLTVPTSPKTGPNSAANAEDRFRYEELCKDNEVKLVRVTAQIDSPTVFLRLLGFPTITLTESSISQTAVLDVVLILDVSESMSYATTYDDWEQEGYYYRYMPPYVPRDDYEGWELLRTRSWDQLMNEVYAAGHPLAGQYIFKEVQVDANTNTAISTQIIDLGDGATRLQTGPTVRFLPDDMPTGVTSNAPPPQCTVRVSPNSVYNTGAEIPPWLMEEYNAKFGSSWVMDRFQQFTQGTANQFRGFVPMYRSYACCNDPNGDFDFSDLVCQPFQQVRDATNQFLNNLDFIRGDRVAFVTFDNTARILDPDGSGSQRWMIEIEESGPDTPPGLLGARQVLEQRVGVRAVDSYYRDMNDNGTWDALVDFDPYAYDPNDPNAAWRGFDWNHFQSTMTQDIFVHPTTGSCFLDNAILQFPQVPEEYHRRLGASGDVRAQWPLLAEAISSPNWFWDAANVNPADPAHIAEYWNPTKSQPDLRSAEYRGGCGGGNIGGALNGAQQVFIEDGRTEGAVWLMVLMSDGASGVTDPIARSIDDVSGDMDLQFPNPYNTFTVGGTVYRDPLPGDYGAFGACPYGTAGAWGEVLKDINTYPYCSDPAPETRHFCSSMPMPPSLIELDTAPPECEQSYDPDDYARDWADWIALANLPSVGRTGNEQLPTIFTIGIGMDYSPFNSAGVRVCQDNDWNCRKTQRWSYEDYLGEQLLRYIADAGDNFQIDDDYWQGVLGARIPNTIENWLDKTDINWGARGPCEVQSSDPNDRGLWLPLDPQQSCGNYFAAAEASDLERVFDIIASRMFTRLSQ